MSKTVVEMTNGQQVAIPTRTLKAIATTRDKARRGMTEYRIEPIDAPNGMFMCVRPKDLPPLYDEWGNIVVGYEVNVVLRTCQCHVWINTKSQLGDGECKHLIYTTKVVEKALRVLGIWNSPRTLEDCAEQEVRSWGGDS
jgi:hypothetical protein